MLKGPLHYVLGQVAGPFLECRLLILDGRGLKCKAKNDHTLEICTACVPVLRRCWLYLNAISYICLKWLYLVCKQELLMNFNIFVKIMCKILSCSFYQIQRTLACYEGIAF